jgi:ribose transport system substrate-binding protein
MSHELRTPMNAILGFSQLLKLDDTLTNKQKDFVREIIMGGNHLMELINEVLDLSKIEAGKLRCSLEDCNLNNILKECLTFIEPLATKHSIQIFNNINPTTNYTIHADRTRFKQVMFNLLSNAVKYNSDKGTVTLSCDVMDNDQLRINVSDTGNGLTEQEQQRLFKHFERIGEYKGIEGTGIGLIITKRLIELMGGTVGVESEIGKGSRFWIQVPLS